ncbi:4-hydroxy-tetrahydrodipicolinate reductase [Acidisarcina polymorpha]|uniref:4-hydroxy-tetrahydrodipicolinate reductase n=1 Tax=Acidisarcina polymorpha TaxID=2211140 RepID=A0A2Z5FUH6_9BACT|nr:dihydrodipicolinate reductase C-terminal domain-containing protein [Acidisarcina polymorpha]AXC10511.1 4-hydroxy-tetrahydrodipicolinate reductase [Acidisarcina polymorpha]
MLFLVLGRGKTGSLVAEVAKERGHSVRVIGEEANVNGSAITAPFLAQFDAVIDFTTPEAVIPNMRACLATGAHMVVGTTGWLEHLKDLRALAERRHAGLVYGSNFSIGVHALYKVAHELAQAAPGFKFRIVETHHVDKKDSPSGTALTLKLALESANPHLNVPIESKREGDTPGIHVIESRTDSEVIELRHESFSRRGFAEGAVRAAEWISTRQGVFEFRDVYEQFD